MTRGILKTSCLKDLIGCRLCSTRHIIIQLIRTQFSWFHCAIKMVCCFDPSAFALAFALFGVSVAYTLYVVIIKNWNYFSARNVAFERGLPLLGSQYKTVLGKSSLFDTLAENYRKNARKHRIVGMYELGGQPSHMILDPKLIRDITIKDFDHFVNHNLDLDTSMDPLFGRVLQSMTNDNWRNMRSTLSPLFRGSKIRYMVQLLSDATNDFVSHIEKEILVKSPKDGIEYDMNELRPI